MRETDPGIIDHIRRDLRHEMGVREVARKHKVSTRTVLRVRDLEHPSFSRLPLLGRCADCGNKQFPLKIGNQVVPCYPCHLRDSAAERTVA